MFRSIEYVLVMALIFGLSTPIASAFQVSPQASKKSIRDGTKNYMALKIGKNYEPKWKKKETLADMTDETVSDKEKGLIGTIPVIFKEGDNKKTTMAMVGQPIRDVASQAGVFIKYGCGKGECGTCEALCNGKWIRPCTALVPADIEGEEYLIQVKDVKVKSKSSGKFYSVRSFFMGFYNNLVGMVGFVLTRRAAKKNYEERMEFEAMVLQKAMEKKAARKAELAKENKS